MNEQKSKEWLSRKQKVALSYILVIMLIAVCYMLRGCPPFSAKDHFRQRELRMGLGPSKILDVVSLENFPACGVDRMIVATGDHGVTLFTYNKADGRNGYKSMYYREKKDDITVCAVPHMVSFSYLKREDYPVKVPVVVFDDVPDAVRAEMDITLSSRQQSLELAYEERLTVSAERKKEGFFLFSLCSNESAGNTSSAAKFYQAVLNMMSDSEVYIDEKGEYCFPVTPVTVRFYDRDGNLIATHSAVVQSISAEAYQEHKEKKAME